jgi:hypothetical protein
MVDFSNILQQKFDDFELINETLILFHKKIRVEAKIYGSIENVRNMMKLTLENKNLFDSREVSLNELKHLPVIDKIKRDEIRYYIDDLIFALYFNVPLRKIGLKYAKLIKMQCQNNKFYKIIQHSTK